MPTLATTRRKVLCTVDGQPVQAVDLTFETESIDVTPMSESRPDPKWQFVDAAGHFHAYAKDGETPTLQQIAEEHWCGDCHEDHTEYTTVCAICSEEIRPGTITGGGFSKSIPGTTTWTLKVLGVVEGERVSVRVEEGGRDSFGIMHVGPSSMEFGRPATTVLVGFLTPRLG